MIQSRMYIILRLYLLIPNSYFNSDNYLKLHLLKHVVKHTNNSNMFKVNQFHNESIKYFDMTSDTIHTTALEQCSLKLLFLNNALYYTIIELCISIAILVMRNSGHQFRNSIFRHEFLNNTYAPLSAK